jgi:hypothetical protein
MLSRQIPLNKHMPSGSDLAEACRKDIQGLIEVLD